MDRLQQLLVTRLIVAVQFAVLDAEAVAPEDKAALGCLQLLLFLVIIITERSRNALRTAAPANSNGWSVLRPQSVAGTAESPRGRSGCFRLGGGSAAACQIWQELFGSPARLLEYVIDKTTTTTATALVGVLNSEAAALATSVQLVSVTLVLRGLFGLLGTVLM